MLIRTLPKWYEMMHATLANHYKNDIYELFDDFRELMEMSWTQL